MEAGNIERIVEKLEGIAEKLGGLDRCLSVAATLMEKGIESMEGAPNRTLEIEREPEKIKWIPTSEAAIICEVSVPTFTKYAKQNGLNPSTAFGSGKSKRWNQAEVHKMMEELK